MGFVYQVAALSGSTVVGDLASQTRSNLTAGDPLSISIPSAVRDGDLLLAWFISPANPTTAWSTPSGWSSAMTQKDGTSSFGGRSALFKKVWRAGDSMTVASSGPGGSDTHAFVFVIRSDTDGASLSIGTVAENEGTVATTTMVVPKITIASKYDVRIFFSQNTSSSSTVSPPAVTPSADNQFGVVPTLVAEEAVSLTITCVHVTTANDPSGVEAGSTNWTIGSGKYYCFNLAINDPNATRNGMSMGEEIEVTEALVPISATGVEHATIVSSGGGHGGGIAVG